MKLLCLASTVLGLLSLTTLAQAGAVPLVNQPLLPTSVAPGSGAFTLTVTGTGFVPGAKVLWNRAARATTFVSTSELQASISASDVAKASTASVSVFNPRSGGGFSSVVYFPIRQSSPTFSAIHDLNFTPHSKELAVGDFNNDGNLDVAIANDRNQVDVYLGNGNGTFSVPVTTVTTTPIHYLYAAEFDGDGNLDLLISGSSSLIALLAGHGDGTFTQGPTSRFAGAGNSFAVGDFNGDGKLDIVEGTPDQLSGPDVQVYMNMGNGTFLPGWAAYPCCVTHTGLSAVGDFNGDGKLDIANSGLVFLGNGDGTFTNDSGFYSDVNMTMATADLDGDGILDLVGDQSSVALGNGDGTFGPMQNLGFFGINVSLADVNGDGRLDMILRNPTTPQTIAVLLGSGDGTFQSPIGFTAGISNGEEQVDQMRVGDFNNDGKLDIITGARSTFLLLQQ